MLLPNLKSVLDVHLRFIGDCLAAANLTVATINTNHNEKQVSPRTFEPLCNLQFADSVLENSTTLNPFPIPFPGKTPVISRLTCRWIQRMTERDSKRWLIVE